MMHELRYVKRKVEVETVAEDVFLMKEVTVLQYKENIYAGQDLCSSEWRDVPTEEEED